MMAWAQCARPTACVLQWPAGRRVSATVSRGYMRQTERARERVRGGRQADRADFYSKLLACLHVGSPSFPHDLISFIYRAVFNPIVFVLAHFHFSFLLNLLFFSVVFLPMNANGLQIGAGRDF